jgi:hypothetical protein
MSQNFLSPRLTGKRFDDHTIPLELFEDFSVFEELLIELAKHIYFEENIERHRVPNGFYDEVSLKLARISEGSAIPALMLAAATIAGQPNPNLPYYEKAKERIIKAVDAAETNSNITSHIPGHLLTYFNRIGKGLREDEVIDLSPDTSYKALLNKSTRKKLVLASSLINEILYEMVIIASVFEVDKQRETFTVVFGGGQKVVSRIPKEHKKAILKAFDNYENKTKIKINGIGKFNKQDRLINIDAIKHISILDPLDINARIDELSYLKDGWYNGEGVAPHRSLLKVFNEYFEAFYDATLPLPYLYPTIDGGLQAEWVNENFDVSLEVEVNKNASLHSLNKKTEEVIEFESIIENLDVWTHLNKILKDLLKA